MSKVRKSISAADLMSRLQDDSEYQAQMRAKEQARLASVARNRQAAIPVVQELVAAGFAIDSIADLRDHKTGYAAAIPILLAWLPRVENCDVKEDIVRCLSVPLARSQAAGALIAEFRRSDATANTRWVIGNALDVVADDGVLDDMIELATERGYGKTREMVVAGLGNMKDKRVVAVLLDLLKDDEVNGFAVKALGRLAVPAELNSPLVRSQLEPFLKHRHAWVRKEARRTIERIDQVARRLH